MLFLKPGKPRSRLARLQKRLGLFGERREKRGMAGFCGLSFSGRFKHFRRKVTDDLEHPQTQFAARQVFADKQAFVD